MNRISPVTHLILALATFLLFFLLFKTMNKNGAGKGSLLYAKLCENCHGKDGKGLKGLYPPLAQADYLLVTDPGILACMVKQGVSDSIIVNGQLYNQAMPGFPTLTPVDITNLLNYISNEWGNERAYITADQVEKGLANCKE
jgi:mono/diheme cytochrome c family protein